MKTKKHYKTTRSEEKFVLTSENLKFPEINKGKKEFKMRTIEDMRGNLDLDRMRDFYNRCDSTWDGTSMNSGSVRSDERLTLPVFDRDQIKNTKSYTSTL